jgi:hypothetical protein
MNHLASAAWCNPEKQNLTSDGADRLRLGLAFSSRHDKTRAMIANKGSEKLLSKEDAIGFSVLQKPNGMLQRRRLSLPTGT